MGLWVPASGGVSRSGARVGQGLRLLGADQTALGLHVAAAVASAVASAWPPWPPAWLTARSMHSYSWLKGTKSIEQLIWFHFTSFSKAFGSRIHGSSGVDVMSGRGGAPGSAPTSPAGPAMAEGPYALQGLNMRGKGRGGVGGPHSGHACSHTRTHTRTLGEAWARGLHPLAGGPLPLTVSQAPWHLPPVSVLGHSRGHQSPALGGLTAHGQRPLPLPGSHSQLQLRQDRPGVNREPGPGGWVGWDAARALQGGWNFPGKSPSCGCGR